MPETRLQASSVDNEIDEEQSFKLDELSKNFEKIGDLVELIEKFKSKVKIYKLNREQAIYVLSTALKGCLLYTSDAADD